METIFCEFMPSRVSTRAHKENKNFTANHFFQMPPTKEGASELLRSKLGY